MRHGLLRRQQWKPSLRAHLKAAELVRSLCFLQRFKRQQVCKLVALRYLQQKQHRTRGQTGGGGARQHGLRMTCAMRWSSAQRSGCVGSALFRLASLQRLARTGPGLTLSAGPNALSHNLGARAWISKPAGTKLS